MIALEGLTVALGGGTALRGVDLEVAAGARLGVVGESGSGKTMLGLALMGMLPEAAEVIGRVRVADHELTALPEPARARLRGPTVAMVFQDPMSALNPLQRIGTQIAEPMRWHEGIGRGAARERALALLREVGLPEPEARLAQYPHELSGGQRQRAMIALALACNPKVLIADEPTTALDAVVAARVLDLLREVAERRGMTLILISHDLGAVERAAERIAVLYSGDLMETGAVGEVLAAP
ncbi:MAG: ABC transporter ATP-binding protein, partial [Pseudomonadota bacterium]